MSLYRLQIPKNRLDNRSAIDDDIIIPTRDEETIRKDFNNFLSLDDNTINTKGSSKSIKTKNKKRKTKNNDNNENNINNEAIVNDNSNNGDVENTDNDNAYNNNIPESRLGSKLLKRLNYFWGNVKRNSTKVKFESASKKVNFVTKEEKIRQSLIRLFQLQYERELIEKEEQASKRMTRRLLALIISEKSNTPNTNNSNSTVSSVLLPSIFQKRK
jgi:hypothetical protein